MLKAFNVKLPAEVIKRLRHYSKKRGMFIWRVVTDAINEYLSKENKDG